MPKVKDEEYIRDEYCISPVAIVCHSSDHGYYFSDYQFAQPCHSISHMICIVQKSNVGRLYCSPEVSTRLQIAKVPSIWNEAYNINHFTKFGNDFLVKNIRDEYAFAQPFYEVYPTTNNGIRKVIDFYCLNDSFRFTIDLDQENVFYSNLNVDKIPTLLPHSYGFCNWNTLIPQQIFYHRYSENDFNKMCMIVQNDQFTTLEPLIIKDDGSMNELSKQKVAIQSIPLDSNKIPLYWSFLTRLDCIDENYITYTYWDYEKKKINHLIRKVSVHYDENASIYTGNLSKSPFLDFFKYFTDPYVVSGSCRLTETCFMFLLCKKSSGGFDIQFKDWKTFKENSKWILVDLKNSIIKSIDPYSGILKDSQSTKTTSSSDEDGFVVNKRKKHITNRKIVDEIRTEGKDFQRVDLTAYQPFRGYPELVNVLCSISCIEIRTSHAQQKKQSLSSVIQIHYCFKINDESRQLFKEIPKFFNDVEFRV